MARAALTMTLATVVLAIFLSPQCAQAADTTSVAGVQKVIQMLTDMSSKGKQAKKDEEVAFAQFETWCSMGASSLEADIKKEAEQIELLTAEIGELGTQITGLGEDIAKLESDKTNFEATIAAEKAQREKDHAAFLAEEKDFSESVDALARALEILEKQNHKRPGTAGAAALLQVASDAHLPEQARSLVQAFLGLAGEQDPLGGLDYAAPEADAYDFQSGGIIAILKKLQDDFREKLGQSQKEEKNSQQASDMVVNDLTDSVENNARRISEKTSEKEEKSAQKAEDEKQLASTQAVKAENEKTLANMDQECHEKKLSFAEKQQLRTEEIAAIEKAIEILQSPDVLGSAQKHLSLAQAAPQHGRTALLQIAANSVAERMQGVHRRLREFLAAEGQRLHSQRLTFLAQQVMADPFAKVKKLIDDLITRLEEEANTDAVHEGYCDTEMGKSQITRTKLSETIDSLTAAIDSGKSTVLKLTEDDAQLSKEVQELESSLAEALDLRTKEKAANEQTIDDARKAQTAVAAATAVLKDFYAKAGTATGFLQIQRSSAPSPRAWGLKSGIKMGTDEWKALANPNYQGSTDTGHKEGMQTFGESYFGETDEAQYGVLGLLEVILSDFATLEADTSAAEAAAAESHERFVVECRQSLAVKRQKIELNEADKASTEAKVLADTADLKGTQDELLAAERYHANLVPQCIDQGSSWQEHQDARQAEINSLKEALQILSGSEIA